MAGALSERQAVASLFAALLKDWQLEAATIHRGAASPLVVKMRWNEGRGTPCNNE